MTELHILFDRLDDLRWKFKAADSEEKKKFLSEEMQKIERQIQVERYGK